jgi:outer membrane protein assembly factor BamD (BamD/ComL family)
MARNGDPAAGVAAFTLGRLELDVLHRPERAVRAFARALDTTLPARLREDAAARLVDAYVRAGDTASAQRAAENYLREYPEGRHADTVRRQLP